jgi:ElaB/YqjD/DUF883 family membrane-anchored ribosome-binding protein
MFNKTADAANHLINQTAQSAEDTIKQSQNLANSALDGVQGAIQDIRRQAAPLLDSVRDGSHQLRVKAAQASDDTVNYIKHEPVKSMLIAAATGAALMALISLFTSRRDHN